MEPEWAVLIGIGIAGLIREIYLLIKSVVSEESNGKKNSKTAGIISIVCGLLIVIPFVSVLGLVLGVYAYRTTIYKGISITGVILNIIGVLIWTMVLMNP